MLDPGLITRRDLLQAAGFTLVASSVGGCSRLPDQQRVAPLQSGERGAAARHVATTCAGCSAGCGVLAVVRDGRTVKLEGNPTHPLSRGGLCAAGQASLLGIYDDRRVFEPRIGGAVVPWVRSDDAVRDRLHAARHRGGGVRLLTGTDAAASPTTAALVARLLASFDDARHDAYDMPSCAAVAQAHAVTHGHRRLPRIRLDRAEVVLALDADFLGTWLSPVEFAAAYSAARPRRHVQVESRVSLTGAKADTRWTVAPHELGGLVRALSDAVQALVNGDAPRALETTSIESAALRALARELYAAHGRALVVSGSTDVAVQVAVNRLNAKLGAYGATLDLAHPSRQRLGDDHGIARLAAELDRGDVDVLIVAGVNPLHDLPDPGAWRRRLAGVRTLVVAGSRPDETLSVAEYVCAIADPLESWGDCEPVSGLLAIRQPTAQARGAARTLDECLAAWSGEPALAYDLVRRHWQHDIYDPRTDGPSFELFWDATLREGWCARAASRDGRAWRGGLRPSGAEVYAASAAPRQTTPGIRLAPELAEFTLVAYASPTLIDGRNGGNPWLHELPDPIGKTTWESCLSVSPGAARRLRLVDGDVVRVVALAGGHSVEFPILVQPGQHDAVVAVPIGFGQVATRRYAAIGPEWAGAAEARENETVGSNVAPLLAGTVGSIAPHVRLEATGRRVALARAQVESRQTPLRRLPGPPVEKPVRFAPSGGAVEAPPSPIDPARRSLWRNASRDSGIRWGMVIDLDACTGCSACVVACQAENNIPLVGRDEVRRHREMHWMRIDRYVEDHGAGGVEIVHQPMTCHHCGHAPCETVCPVGATSQDGEGLNQQVYSRCVGTRYCMQNCPFKVRRFNWFDASSSVAGQGLPTNPDVSVRFRGVAEKCTFCAHRITETKIAARTAGRSLQDGDVSPACAQSCPSRAITFGDLNDPASRVARAARDPRAYGLFDALNLAPALRYLAVTRRPPLAAAEIRND